MKHNINQNRSVITNEESRNIEERSSEIPKEKKNTKLVLGANRLKVTGQSYNLKQASFIIRNLPGEWDEDSSQLKERRVEMGRMGKGWCVCHSWVISLKPVMREMKRRVNATRHMFILAQDVLWIPTNKHQPLLNILSLSSSLNLALPMLNTFNPLILCNILKLT